MKQIKKDEYSKDFHIEQNLLIESQDREEKLSKRLNSTEIELNKLKQELTRVYNENEKLVLNHQELSAEIEQLKDNLSKQRAEIKSLKERENRLLVDNTELDGENVQLQEQIAKLKEDLVELDTIKHENKALEEKLETLESQIIELATLKRIVEKQLEESLNSFREERESKFLKNRESQKQSLKELKSLANNLSDGQIGLYDIEDDDDQENVDEQNDTNNDNRQEASLFNEMHVNDLERLEKNIQDLNKNKDTLECELNEFKNDLNYLINNIESLNRKLPNSSSSSDIDRDKIGETVAIEASAAPNHHHAKENINKQTISTFDRFKHDLEQLLCSPSSVFNSNETVNDLNKKLDMLKSESNLVHDNLVSFSICLSRNK
jgi:chromosome segregation ATPase